MNEQLDFRLRNRVREMKAPFYTIRLRVGKGGEYVSSILDYYPTREEAEKEVERAYRNYGNNAIISHELLDVQVKPN